MSRPVAEGLFTSGPHPRLLAARRVADGKVVFPAPEGKAAEGYETFELSPEGRLWSYTIQRFPPKTPYAGQGSEGSGEAFAPFAVGYVEIHGEAIVEGWLLAPDLSALKVGLPMRLTTVPLRHDADGQAVMTYAFEVAEEI